MIVICDNESCIYCKSSKIKFWKNRKTHRCGYKGTIALVTVEQSEIIYGTSVLECIKYESKE